MKHKFVKLIVPLYVWNLIYGIFLMILRNFNFTFGYDISLESLLLSPLYSGHDFIFNMGSWFLVPLFMLQIFSLIFLPLLKKGGSYIVSFIYLLMGMIGIQLSINGLHTDWWLCLTRFLYFLPFFGLGIMYKDKLEKLDNSSNFKYFTVIFFLQLCAIFIAGKQESYTPSWCRGFQNIYMPYIFGFLGLAFWLRISKILAPLLHNNKIVNTISKNTFSIMMHQFLGFFLLNCCYLFISKCTTIIDGFHIHEFKTSIWYMYLPKNLPQFKLLYLISGIIIPIFIVFLIDTAKQKIKKTNLYEKA